MKRCCDIITGAVAIGQNMYVNKYISKYLMRKDLFKKRGGIFKYHNLPICNFLRHSDFGALRRQCSMNPLGPLTKGIRSSKGAFYRCSLHIDSSDNRGVLSL